MYTHTYTICSHTSCFITQQQIWLICLDLRGHEHYCPLALLSMKTVAWSYFGKIELTSQRPLVFTPGTPWHLLLCSATSFLFHCFDTWLSNYFSSSKKHLSYPWSAQAGQLSGLKSQRSCLRIPQNELYLLQKMRKQHLRCWILSHLDTLLAPLVRCEAFTGH